jgi:hypothetical protein
MPLFNIPIDPQQGVLVDLWIGPTRQDQDGQMERESEPTKPQQLQMLLDTGASRTHLDPAVISRLKLRQDGQTELITPTSGSDGTPARQFRCCAVLRVDGIEMEWPDLLVTEAPMANQGVDGLMGRDLLRSLAIFWDGIAGSATLAF